MTNLQIQNLEFSDSLSSFFFMLAKIDPVFILSLMEGYVETICQLK